jgi:predicted thioesterase
LSSTINIKPGMTGTETTVVTRELTVAHFHPEMPEVYGTPFMIYLMEVAASHAIQAHLPQGHTSVGTSVDIQHVAATPVGRTVTAKAKVISVDGRRVMFAVEAHDGVERIGAGSHGRTVIDVARFLKGLEAKR